MGKRFDKEAKEAAAGRTGRSLKNSKGRVPLVDMSQIDTDEGKASRDTSGSLMDLRARAALLPGEVEAQARALRNLGEGQAGGRGRRR